MDDNHWNIATARRRFSDVVRSAAREPQALYNRGQIVAAVVDADELRAFQEWKASQSQRSLGDAFKDLRAICLAEHYELAVAQRADRPNPFDDPRAKDDGLSG